MKHNILKTFDLDKLIALSEETKEILFCKCKWQDLKLKDAKKLLENLKEKSTFVDWNKAERKEYFGIIAKKIERKEELRERGFTVFDLEDFSLSPSELPSYGKNPNNPKVIDTFI